MNIRARIIIIVSFIIFALDINSQNINQRISELDTLAITMQKYFEGKDYNKCIPIGKTIMLKYMDVLTEYPYKNDMAYMITICFDQCNKYQEIPKIVDSLLPYLDEASERDSIAIFTILGLKYTSYLNMGKQELAMKACEYLYNYYYNGTFRDETIENGINHMKRQVDRISFSASRDSTAEILTKLGWSLAIYSKKDPDYKNWDLYHSGIRHLLTDYYYNIDSPSDENLWLRLILTQDTFFSMFNRDLPDRTSQLYDNILVHKNFLDFHSSRRNIYPNKWTDVQSSLTSNDIAIEISQYPAEILILDSESISPKSIIIDSTLLVKISTLAIDEPLAINQLYDINGPLHELWKLIEPYMGNKTKNIFISGSNLFTQINYSAIPLDKDTILCDKYNVVNMESTAFIKDYKCQEHTIECNNIVLYGGINYNKGTSDNKDNQAKINTTSNISWTLTRSIPKRTRGSFGYLPGSLYEVHKIDSILTSSHISHKILTGTDASENSFVDLQNGRTDVLHLSTHGFMFSNLINSNKINVEKIDSTFYQTILYQSGLLLSGANITWKKGEKQKNACYDGILLSKEIINMDLSNIKLVVLSACDTALGNSDNEFGISYGVHYAMKSAGIEECIACLWKISDYATSIFFSEFYSNLIQYHNSSLALYLAQKKFRESKDFSSPYYWSCFKLIE